MNTEPTPLVSEGCLWCGGNGKLETYTESGDIDESTDCVCVLRAELETAKAEADKFRFAAADLDVKSKELAAALAEYAQHKSYCGRFRNPLTFNPVLDSPCVCGLAEFAAGGDTTTGADGWRMAQELVEELENNTRLRDVESTGDAGVHRKGKSRLPTIDRAALKRAFERKPDARLGALMACGCWWYDVPPGATLGHPGTCPAHGPTHTTKMNRDEPDGVALDASWTMPFEGR